MQHKIGLFLKKNSGSILMVTGTLGLVGTIFLVGFISTPKAIKIIEEKESEKKEKLSKGEIVKVIAPIYAPAAGLGVASIVCIFGGMSIQAKKTAAILTAYSLTDVAAKEYQEKVKKMLGEKKENLIHSEIMQDKIDNNPFTSKEIILTEKGNTLCYDVCSGRYYRSDIEHIRRSVNEINKRLLIEMEIPLNDFYYLIGLNNTKLGDKVGWILEKGLLEIKFNSLLIEDNTPCLSVDYNIYPLNSF